MTTTEQKENLLERAHIVAIETEASANDANRIGTLFGDIINGMGDGLTENDEDDYTNAHTLRTDKSQNLTSAEKARALQNLGIPGIATDGDFDNPTPTQRAKVPTVGAILDTGVMEGYVYDVTAMNSGTTFASLEALLSSEHLNDYIPVAKRKGGMSIKFVLSFDNKYVKFFCTADEFTTDITKWQGVDITPTYNSNNLITSGGVYKDALIINLLPTVYDGVVSAAAAVPEGKRRNGTILIFRIIDKDSYRLSIWQYHNTSILQWSNINYWNNLLEDDNISIIEYDTDYATTFGKIPAYKRKKGYIAIILKPGFNAEALIFENSSLGNAAWNNINSWYKIAISEECVKTKYGKNLFSGINITENYYIKSDGDISYNSSYSVSDFIPVEPNTEYHLSIAGDSAVASSSTYINFYRFDKVMLSPSLATSKDITTPNNCGYIKITFFKNSLSTVMVEKGSSRSPYEPFSPIGGYPFILPEDFSVGTDRIENGAVTPAKLGNFNFSNLKNVSVTEISSLGSGETYEDSNFPQTIKKCKIIHLHITTLTSFTGIYVGWGKTQDYGVSVYVDATKVYIRRGSISGTKTEIGTHGLNISTFLHITIIQSNNGNAKIIVDTIDGSYTCEYAIGLYHTRGKVYVMSDATAASNVTLTASSIDLSKDVWIFGDSYLSISDARWPYYIVNLGVQNVSWFAYPGASTENEYDDLLRALNFGKPKYLVWALGMNNSDTTTAANSTWSDRLTKVINLCTQYQITLILATIPCVPASGHENYFKNEVVRQAGYRYIDFAKSVNAETQGATWYADMLSSDNLHPTILGAQTLFNQVLKDFPEIMLFDNLNYSVNT